MRATMATISTCGVDELRVIKYSAILLLVPGMKEAT
jgi:hypothetical protein